MPEISRWMPPSPQQTVSPWVVIAPFAAGVVGALVLAPPLGVGMVALTVIGAALAKRNQGRLRALADARAGEDIGSYARAFDRRRMPFDPWVARAVWDALASYMTVDGKRIALRPSDNLGTTLHVDPEDLEDCLLYEIFARTGRATPNAAATPYPARVTTVDDLVAFVSAQPPRQAT